MGSFFSLKWFIYLGRIRILPQVKVVSCVKPSNETLGRSSWIQRLNLPCCQRSWDDMTAEYLQTLTVYDTPAVLCYMDWVV